MYKLFNNFFVHFAPKLTFQALDREKHVVDTQLGVEILILDSNDNPPKFDPEKYEISIKESRSQGNFLM